MKTFIKIFVFCIVAISIILLFIFIFYKPQGISIAEFKRIQDSTTNAYNDNECKRYLYESMEDFKQGNLIYYTQDYSPHLDELLFNKYGILVEHIIPDKLSCCKPFMDSIIFCKFGKENIEKLKQEAIEIDKHLESYIYIDGVYSEADVNAQFPGGIDSLIKYKNPNKVKGVEREVDILITIDTLGKVVDAKVYKKYSPEFDKKSLELALKMPNWQPAYNDGKKVKFRRIIDFYW